MRRRFSAAGVLCALVAASLSIVGVEAGASTRSGVASQQLDPRTALNYWTEERMDAAKPLPLPVVDQDRLPAPPPSSARDPLKIPGTPPSNERIAARPAANGEVFEGGHILPFKRFEITDPTQAPYVTHGQVFGRSSEGFGFGCSGTVVQSENKSVVWTAAHCLYDSRGFSRDVIFVPAYKDGPSSYGTWAATEISVSAEYQENESLQYDFGTMVMAPNEEGVLIGDAVGMRGIAFDQSPAEALQSYGYPAVPQQYFDGERMHSCESMGSGRVFASQISMGCDMQFGSSGGGWIMRGGYLVSNQGGGSPETYPLIAWGPYLGSAARELYNDARGGSGPLPQPTPTTPPGAPKTHSISVNFKLSDQTLPHGEFLMAKGRVRVPDGFLDCLNLTPIHVSRFKKANRTYYPVGSVAFANPEGRFAVLLPDRPGKYIVRADESPYDLTNNCALDYSDPVRHLH